MSDTDLELLARYAHHNAEEAFAEVVRRHLDLVYSAALRQVRSPQLAEEVAQSVFLKLSAQARGFTPRTILAAWLYQVTRRDAIDLLRREARRQLREQIAFEMNTMNTDAADWMQVEPILDEAMHALDETDRAAILLRYFENKSLREVGQMLGTSDDAAQKRVSRAVERLREILTKRGITVGASGLALIISAHAVQAAPAGLSVAITATVVTGAAIQTSAAVAATTTLTMTTLQKTLIGTALAVAMGGGIYEAREASAARDDARMLRQGQAPLLEHVQQLTRERDDFAARQALLQQENERLRQASADVPRLRGEVGRLQAMSKQAAPATAGPATANDPAIQQFLQLKAQAAEIQRHLERMPGKKIPELKLLLDEDWLSAVRTAKFDTDADVRRTLGHLRGLAKNRVPIARALNDFINANNGQLPSELSQLKPHIQSALGEVSVDDETLTAILDRYKLLRSGTASDLPSGAWIVVEKAPVDKDYDSRAKFGNGTSTIIGTGLNSAGDPDDTSY